MSILQLFPIIAWFKVDVESYDLKVLKTIYA